VVIKHRRSQRSSDTLCIFRGCILLISCCSNQTKQKKVLKSGTSVVLCVCSSLASCLQLLEAIPLIHCVSPFMPPSCKGYLKEQAVSLERWLSERDSDRVHVDKFALREYVT